MTEKYARLHLPLSIIGLACGCGLSVAPNASPAPEQSVVRTATLDADDIRESSGVAASRVNPGLFWTHNDSGAYAPRVWAFRLSASDLERTQAYPLGYVELTGASLVDWEDISAGPDETLYVLDAGDNPPCERTDKRIYRFREPGVDLNGPAISMSLPVESARFEYPADDDASRPADRDDQRYDAECLLVHPKTGDVFVVTKRDTRSRGIARLYKLPADAIVWDGETMNVLRLVRDLTAAAGVGGVFLTQITGGDVSPDGRRVVLRSYLATAREWRVAEDARLEAVFDATPVRVNLGSVFSERQGEGISYRADGRTLLTTSEGSPMSIRYIERN